MQVNLTAALLLSHLVGDFPLQTNQVYRLKNKSWLGIGLHAIIHVATAALLVREPLRVWLLLALLGILHFLVDLIKLRIPTKHQSVGFVVDQIAHLLVLWLLAQVWDMNADARLPLTVMIPMILYGFFLAILVFLWVVANELSGSNWGDRRCVQWARTHLLQVSQLAGIPLLFSLANHWYHSTSRP